MGFQRVADGGAGHVPHPRFCGRAGRDGARRRRLWLYGDEIKNKSNRTIKVLFDYINNNDYQEIIGTFSKNNLNLKTNEFEFTELILSGNLDDNTKKYWRKYLKNHDGLNLDLSSSIRNNKS